jgi:hypothetical protein
MIADNQRPSPLHCIGDARPRSGESCGFILGPVPTLVAEKSTIRSIVWVVLMMILGFRTASLHTLMALQTSGSDWRRSWLGRRLDGG